MAETPKLELTGSRLFTAWLAERRASLAFTTYQAGKVFFIGLQPDGRLSVFERTFERAMGLSVKESTLWLANLYQLFRFENFLGPGETHQGYDALYVPLESRTTGDVDIHDVGIDVTDTPVFVVTRFNCLATIDDKASFRPIWRPAFIDRLAAEDRCHLNGLAMVDGRPKYVSAVATTNLAEAWREHRVNGGVIIDVDTSETVADGLSMPHSPRLYRDVLYVLNAGTGEFGWIDRKTGRFEPMAFCRGFLRGLTFLDHYAVVGTSLPRDNRTYDGLPLQARLAAEKVTPQCALHIINLKTGDVEHQLTLSGIIEELYDVTALPGILRPMALGFRTGEIRTAIKLGG